MTVTNYSKVIEENNATVKSILKQNFETRILVDSVEMTNKTEIKSMFAKIIVDKYFDDTCIVDIEDAINNEK